MVDASEHSFNTSTSSAIQRKQEKYKRVKTLGQGSFGKVHLVQLEGAK